MGPGARLAGALIGAAALAAGSAQAAEWTPPGPIHLQIGFGAGGETDTLGRVIARQMEEQTGWDVVAENKPGGGGVAMFAGVSKAEPDGTTIGLGVTMPVLINLVLRGDQLPFDVESFDYVGTVARAQLAIVAPADAPFDDVEGLVEHAKAEGGVPVAFDAKPQELILRRINEQTGAGFRPVSTESSSEMIQLVLGGQVPASFSAGAHIPYIESGDLKLLASANDGRHTYAPDTATLREQGFDLFVDPIFYAAAPAGLPEEAHSALAEAWDAAIQTEAVREVVANTLATEPNNRGPEGTREMMQAGLGGVKVLFGE